jgi:hypothetical protein
MGFCPFSRLYCSFIIRGGVRCLCAPVTIGVARRHPQHPAYASKICPIIVRDLLVFLDGPVPAASVLAASYNSALVVLSYIVASVAAYTAVDFASIESA